jgi:hypothetical protein
MGEWFEDESLWREVYPVLFLDERVRQGDEEVSKIHLDGAPYDREASRLIAVARTAS